MNDNCISEFNKLIQMYVIYQNNVKSLHLKTKGSHFFSIHVKWTDDLYERLGDTFDTIAERLLSIDWKKFDIPFIYDEEPKMTYIVNSDDFPTMLRKVRDTIEEICTEIKYCINIFKEINDEATVSLLSDIELEEEKDLWKIKAFLDEV